MQEERDGCVAPISQLEQENMAAAPGITLELQHYGHSFKMMDKNLGHQLHFSVTCGDVIRPPS